MALKEKIRTILHRWTAPPLQYPIPNDIPLTALDQHTIESLTRLQHVRDLCTLNAKRIDAIYCGEYVSEHNSQVFAILMEMAEILAS